jgi:antitoxin component of MazEF toxin-antitoxin module
MESVHTRIRRSLESGGIHVPKAFMDEAGLTGDVEILVEPRRVVIQAAFGPREGWDARFREMAEAGDDALIDPVIPANWDRDEWTW